MKKLHFNYLQKLGYVLALCSIISSCSDQEQVIPTPEPVDQYLVDAQFLQSFDKDQILLLASHTEYREYGHWIAFGIDLYKITYFTTYQDQVIEASGLLCIPKDLEAEAPLLAGLHGTIIDNSRAPSNFGNKSGLSGLEIFASLGFITVIPDYIGFGESEEIFHPYYDVLYAGKATTDMLQAVQEFLKEEKIPFHEDLFITGYSEGGYVAVSTLKYIEENNLDFKVRATAAGAGGYHIKGLMEDVVDQGVYDSPAYLVYVVYAYNITNGWNRPLTDFFREPYASQIPAYADGSLSIGQLNSTLPKELDQLFTAAFLEGIKDGTETAFIQALEQNSVHHWAPQSSLRLYHEEDDEIVPITNSEETYETMQSLGAEHTAYFPYDDATSHASGALHMYHMAVPWFISLKD